MRSRRPAESRVVHALTELAELQASLRARRAATEAAEAAARQQGEAKQREQRLFAESVGRVAPLRRPPVAPLPRARPAPLATQRLRDERAALAESIGAALDVESLLETDDALSYRRSGVGIDVVRKLRRGVWALQAELDLHGLRRDEARARLAGFVARALRDGLRCVRVVHGKGLGSPGREPVLKEMVRSVLARHRDVLAFAQARASEGGAGALMVLLQPAAGAPRRSGSGGELGRDVDHRARRR